MAAMSGTLGRNLSSPPAATSMLFAVALAIALATTFSTGAPTLSAIGAAPRYLLLGGTCIAFYALSITYLGPHFGIANAILCVLLGQMVSAAVIDHLGLLGAPVLRITPVRLLGLGLMCVGLFLARSIPATD
ncbi:MAG: DMT family transporter [Sphingosinicella sp.]|nr:DMT family transporter [Sphingosinicella sp.]